MRMSVTTTTMTFAMLSHFPITVCHFARQNCKFGVDYHQCDALNTLIKGNGFTMRSIHLVGCSQRCDEVLLRCKIIYTCLPRRMVCVRACVYVRVYVCVCMCACVCVRMYGRIRVCECA